MAGRRWGGGLNQMLFLGTSCKVWGKKTEIGFLMKTFKFFVDLILRFYTPFPVSLKKLKLTASFNGDEMDIW